MRRNRWRRCADKTVHLVGEGVVRLEAQIYQMHAWRTEKRMRILRPLFLYHDQRLTRSAVPAQSLRLNIGEAMTVGLVLLFIAMKGKC